MQDAGCRTGADDTILVLIVGTALEHVGFIRSSLEFFVYSLQYNCISSHEAPPDIIVILPGDPPPPMFHVSCIMYHISYLYYTKLLIVAFTILYCTVLYCTTMPINS